MRSGKNALRGKNDVKLKTGVPDGHKGHTVAGPSSTLSSDSDDDDVTHQLVSSPDHRTHATTSRAAVASLRNGIPDGPGSDSDNRGSGSGSSEDDELRQRSSTRSARGVGTDSPATTPVGSPSQTPGLASSSSEDAPQQANGMNVDSEGPEPGHDALSNEVRTTELNVTERPFNISYIPCHTWPPCAVCARINGEPPQQVATSSFMVVRQRQVTLAREVGRNVAAAQSTSLTINASASASANQASLRLPSLSRPPDAASARPEFMPPPTSPPPMPYDSPPPNRSRPTDPPRTEVSAPTRMPASANVYPPPNYPMEPLFVSAGVAPQSGRGNTFRGGAPGSGTGRGTAPPTIPHVIQQVTLSSVSAPVRHSPYARPQRNASVAANAQASSSSLRIEDMRGPQIGGERRLRGRGRQKSKKVRAKRYNRKKREEWPPEGWNPIWEEERPRRWEGYDIPDDVATDKVYDHLRRRFDLKSMGQCKWEGCIPTEASKDGYKMLKRHVETVHLGLKLVCQLCGVRKRADNRRKATHKRGCPEREDGPGGAQNGSASAGPTTGTASAGGSAVVQTKTAGKTKATDADGDTQMDDEEMNNDEEGPDGSDSGEGEGEGEGEEEDELEEDELEEDQLDEDQDEAGDQPIESEFESEDD